MQAELAEVIHPPPWRGPELEGQQGWLYCLTDADLGEIDAALARVRRSGTTLVSVSRKDFPLPNLSTQLGRIASGLQDGLGFVLLRGLQLSSYDEDDASIIFWGIGSHLGRPVAQNAAGDLLGHVRDTGQDFEKPNVRGYQTRAALNYHSDFADIVGLLCLKPAKSGGLSAIASSVAVHNEILRRRPDLLRELYEPYYFDRREEVRGFDERFFKSPIYSYHEGRLSMRYVRGFINVAQQHPEVPRLTAAQREAIDLIDEIANSPSFNLQMDFHVGDMQFLNNYSVLHSRTEYEDYEDPREKRHLLRMWLVAHDRPPLAADFGSEAAGTRGWDVGVPGPTLEDA